MWPASRRLFIRNEQRGCQLQTQTDDHVLLDQWKRSPCWVGADVPVPGPGPSRAVLPPLAPLPSQRREECKRSVKPAQQIELANLSKRD
jgi:hypothetical protein